MPTDLDRPLTWTERIAGIAGLVSILSLPAALVLWWTGDVDLIQAVLIMCLAPAGLLAAALVVAFVEVFQDVHGGRP